MAAAGYRIIPIALACVGCTSIAVDARTFEGTRWHVTAINGHPTPAIGDYHLEFTNDQISGRFGCNGWGGSYSVSDNMLTASQVRSTLMACAEPAMSFESEGLAVLQQPMRLAFVANSVTLSDAAGSISLERLP